MRCNCSLLDRITGPWEKRVQKSKCFYFEETYSKAVLRQVTIREQRAPSPNTLGKNGPRACAQKFVYGLLHLDISTKFETRKIHIYPFYL
jgi:hypothetical protein